jgi:class 3 adenylate cyclase/tetratricopeptide (TPR) repeat protein
VTRWDGPSPASGTTPEALPLCDHLSGVVLFADLADFTGLSERLSASGPSATEALSTLLNGYFAILISGVTAAGGEVTTFAGDALAAVFLDGPGGRAESARAAVSCARTVQGDLAGWPGVPAAVGPRPKVRIGVGGGDLVRAVVGVPGVRLLHVLAGPAVERAVSAQRRAAPGDVVTHPRLTAAEVLPGGRTRPSERPPGRAASWANAASRPPDETHALTDEHRVVTTAFIGLPTLDPLGDGIARLQELVADSVPVVERFGGDLRQVDAGDKGFQLVLGFGAPRSGPDDVERAVACAVELVGRPGGPLRAGLATGPAFCADVGTEQRREYVVIGSSVNLAARLVQSAAPGQVRMDAGTARRAQRVAVQQFVGALPLKGLREPVAVHAVSGLREHYEKPVQVGGGRPGAFIGREMELGIASRCLDRAAGGSGQLLLVTGEPGIGKSRLCQQVLERAGTRWTVAAGTGGAPGDVRPYLAWRPVWKALLPSPGASLDAALSALAESDERAPLLGPVLGVPLADNDFTASLDPAARAAATRALLRDCLLRRASTGPVAVLLDDCHWLDELSMRLLEDLAGNLPGLPVLVIAVAREEEAVQRLLGRLAGMGHVTHLSLQELPASEADQLVRDRLAALRHGGQVVGPDLSRIARRGGGNPLFLEQLVEYAADPGTPLDDDLPPDVRRLVLARVDRLVPRGRATIKTASVIGEGFSAGAITACLPEAGSPGQVARHLRHLQTLGLVRARADDSDPSYEFAHSLVQEVVYDSLSRSGRSALHEAVGGYLEVAHAADLAGWVDLVAFHYGRGNDVGKQRQWFRAAGDASRAAYANEAAIDYYRRLLGVSPDGERAQILVQVGAVRQLTGAWPEAEAALREAVRLASDDNSSRVVAEAERELGILLLATRQHAEAVQRLRAAAAAFTELGDAHALCRSLDRLAFALFEHGELGPALDVARRQLAVQEDLHDQAGLSAALLNNALIHWHTGEHAVALRMLRRSYVLARRSGDLRATVHAANDLAGLYADRGDHRMAVRRLQEAIRVAERIGYRQALAYLTGNAGELYRDRGAYEEASRCFAAGLRAALDIGDWITTVRCVTALAVTAADAGVTGAEGYLRRATSIAGAVHQSYVLAEVTLRRAQAAWDRGDLAEAEVLAERAEDAASRRSEPALVLRPRLLRIRVAVARGRRPAEEAVAEVTAMLDRWPEAPERALLLDTIAQLDSRAGPAAAEAAEIYRDLYLAAPTITYAEAYRRLTGGHRLPPPAPLPALGGVVDDAPLDLDAVLTGVERLAFGEAARPLTPDGSR